MNNKEAVYLLAGAFLAVVPARVLSSLVRERQAPAEASVEDMLQDFVLDFRVDPFASRPITFGIRVRDAEIPDWHVLVEGREAAGDEAIVELAEGLPFEPAPFFVTDLETLRAMHAGTLASLTASGKAFSTDFAPLDIDSMPGFVSGPEVEGHLSQLSFHFWTRGLPERVQLGDAATTRRLHGGDAVLLYYQPGFRSGWFRIGPGQHVNETEDMQVNSFPSMMVATKGSMHCRIGGQEGVLSADTAILIGPGVSHEFWVEQGETACEGILLMFGEGA